MRDQCRPIEIDGQIIRVRGAKEPTEADKAALAELVRAVHARWEAMPPEERERIEERQAAALARRRMA